MTTDGVIGGDSDCHAEFKVFWSDIGIYIGTWFYDDVHNAMNSQYLDAANIAYDDDGLEYFFDYNFDDAWNATASTAALYYTHLVKGFGNLNPEIQYGGIWGGTDGSGRCWAPGGSVAEQQAMGWHEVFTSDDGINYTSELFIEWSGSIMRHLPGMAQGEAITFDMKVNDNDGGFTIDGAMHWTGLPHQTNPGLHWGKVILDITCACGLNPSISGQEIPKAEDLPPFAQPYKRSRSMYDIHGRRMPNTLQMRSRPLIKTGRKVLVLSPTQP